MPGRPEGAGASPVICGCVAGTCGGANGLAGGAGGAEGEVGAAGVEDVSSSAGIWIGGYSLSAKPCPPNMVAGSPVPRTRARPPPKRFVMKSAGRSMSSVETGTRRDVSSFCRSCKSCSWRASLASRSFCACAVKPDTRPIPNCMACRKSPNPAITANPHTGDTILTLDLRTAQNDGFSPCMPLRHKVAMLRFSVPFPTS